MDVVGTWTGRHASALRHALRLTNEGFAERLGTAVRTVAKWNADPALVPVPEIQRALDTLLHQAPSDVRERFALILNADGRPPVESEPREVVPEEIWAAADAHVGAALAWLDAAMEWPHGTARRRVIAQATTADLRCIQDRAHQRSSVSQRQIAEALVAYYASPVSHHRPYSARLAGDELVTSILTRSSWLDLSLPLDSGVDHLTFVGEFRSELKLGNVGTQAAIERLAEVLVSKMRVVNGPLYRLLGIDVSVDGISGQVGLVDFLSYALTLDLLENELIDVVATGHPVQPGSLPLRDLYLPDLSAVLNIRNRVCVGGPLALVAIARPKNRARRTEPDYVLLVQERSGRVLNAARRLAVIPKSFHEPLADYSEDAQILLTVEREMEEELFGRQDVDSALADSLSADPMHLSRLSDPMRWLVEHRSGGHWLVEATGFGYNLVSGNFEIACLIVINDEEWWARYGGHIEANWESSGLRRYSSLNRDLLTTLIRDPAWSNEGLFAILQGLRRLKEIGGPRVDIPLIEWELREVG